MLSKLGFSTTGTMRENRTMKCTVTSIAEMKKKERWSFDYRSVENITVIRSSDNSVVTLGDNLLFSIQYSTSNAGFAVKVKSVFLNQQ